MKMAARTVKSEVPVAAKAVEAPKPRLENRPFVIQRKCGCSGGSGGGDACECDQKKVQRKAKGAALEDEVPREVEETLATPGVPLANDVREEMERRFAHDFSGVRIHVDESSARAVNARAYTVGSHIVFDDHAAMREPRLLAHELTHVVQQRSGTFAAEHTISRPDDVHEREADAVADQVMGIPDSMLQKQCSDCPDRPDEEERPQNPRLANREDGSGDIDPDVPVDASSRSHFEPRFGHDFGNVRIHDTPRSEMPTAGIQARAFTPGRVVQQSAVAGVPWLQRKCHATELGAPTPDCTPSQESVVGWQLLFKVGCDDLLPGEDAKINKPRAGNQLKIHGFASRDGDANFNSDLSCHRANRVAAMARALRADCPVIGVFKHGEAPVSTPGGVKDANPPDFWRSVIIEEIKRPLESGEKWLDPGSSINTAWALYRRAQVNPTQPNLMLVWAWRSEMKDWLTSISKTLAPPGAKLTRRDLDDYRRMYASAEQLWMASDQLLALHKYPDADKDTYVAWAVGPGQDQGDRWHAKGVPAGAKYHIDIFGEGYFKGAINIGMAERTSTTGIHDSRVPNLIYRKFSSKDANALPIADHTADLVTSENGPIGMPGLAEEIARIIAPGGMIVLHNPVSEESAHDKVAKATGGVVKKQKSGTDLVVLQTTIVVPGP